MAPFLFINQLFDLANYGYCTITGHLICSDKLECPGVVVYACRTWCTAQVITIPVISIVITFKYFLTPAVEDLQVILSLTIYLQVKYVVLIVTVWREHVITLPLSVN